MEFNTTRWSIIVASHDSDLGISQKALGELCQLYWLPLYSFVRSRVHGREVAEDLTQSFFVHFLESNGFEKADRKKGNFRTFMLSCIKNFMVDEWKKGQAQKRGGGQVRLSLDFDRAERLLTHAADGQRGAEHAYDYHWAKTIMARALNRVREAYTVHGKEDIFDSLKVYLEESEPPCPYSEMAVRIDMKEGAVKVAVHRLRKRYRNALLQEISDTMPLDGDVESEVAYLISIVSS
ncbi:MAG: sigma factor [Candidatus Hydrogenedentota bacterium]